MNHCGKLITYLENLDCKLPYHAARAISFIWAWCTAAAILKSGSEQHIPDASAVRGSR
ncbi:hypothetical protein CY34DRAFT_813366 [Suillus luteus UH-Slu-Lm8-n1]|uniref:Uncharacterized protein n=1 Tax=Suillus luteus UH-Slu-Lm8-n1 TaxID=930992 RepID=A0A0D0AP87_9AGAM|nr:hypothetical protein CY34DRAFT_813366 [Suillus luteus UH-Slu-Lm8-n1]